MIADQSLGALPVIGKGFPQGEVTDDMLRNPTWPKPPIAPRIRVPTTRPGEGFDLPPFGSDRWWDIEDAPE